MAHGLQGALIPSTIQARKKNRVLCSLLLVRLPLGLPILARLSFCLKDCYLRCSNWSRSSSLVFSAFVCFFFAYTQDRFVDHLTPSEKCPFVLPSLYRSEGAEMVRPLCPYLAALLWVLKSGDALFAIHAICLHCHCKGH